MDVDDDLIRTHRQELRRGTVVLASLLALREAQGYGYALLERLAEQGFAVDANTLYPLLRRLEEQGLLTSEWDTSGPRPRKFYATSAAGSQVADLLLADVAELRTAFDRLTGGDAA